MREQGWILIDGQSYSLIPYGSELLEGASPVSRPCGVCGAEPDSRHERSCTLGRGAVYRRPAKCRDCRVEVGSVHRAGCGVEQCPRCGRQFASCSCDSSEDGP